ncbi:hypothetical protein RRG08_025847 [Elysia crispata]|uniref:Uncharacterized protein n=1 Tax=Elysia crispata TaxID=231223 RepID=A0AAE0Y4I9_9GAST|nr:hypothetical protein RRG08_025847 [Elysia crispata]
MSNLPPPLTRPLHPPTQTILSIRLFSQQQAKVHSTHLHNFTEMSAEGTTYHLAVVALATMGPQANTKQSDLVSVFFLHIYSLPRSRAHENISENFVYLLLPRVPFHPPKSQSPKERLFLAHHLQIVQKFLPH